MSDTPHRGERNALGQIARPIRLPWTCHQTGDCCRTNAPLAVTAEEREVLEKQGNLGRYFPQFEIQPEEAAYRDQLRAEGQMVLPNVRFYHLKRDGGGGCPFLAGTSCLVYETRPFNCRRFMCGRVDPTQESYEEGGPMGVYNLSDRVNTSLRFQEYYRGNERRAQKEWALNHGWKK